LIAHALGDNGTAILARQQRNIVSMNRMYLARSRHLFQSARSSPVDQSFGPKNLDPQSTTIQTSIKTPNGMTTSMSTSLDHFL
jgi:hypothetical protein